MYAVALYMVQFINILTAVLLLTVSSGEAVGKM